MSNVSFLLIVVVVSVVGSVVLWIRHRKPTHFMSSVDEFKREMDALGREPGPSVRGRRSSSRSGPTSGGSGRLPSTGPARRAPDGDEPDRGR